ncbi:hypothetical protein [Kamptonema sp. UHCC 0994]|nr:hypothetical protein [Kamptonema sp. UHCC 0994]MDF0553791.1 hypothetical protein [Kamptonema sp. UHCC 0994]
MSEIERDTTPKGRIPFLKWLDSLRDFNGKAKKAKIVKKLERVNSSNLGH